MIYSMTGYANRTLHTPAISIQMDIRSVNHRFFDLTLKLPDEFKGLETALRDTISSKIKRGKLDLRINCTNLDEAAIQLTLNQALFQGYLSITEQIKQHLPEVQTPSIAEILNFPGILSRTTLDVDRLQPLLLVEVELLSNELLLSQQAEGQKLAVMLKHKIQQLEQILNQAQQILPSILTNYRLKLKQKLIDALGEALVNEQRFQQEFAYFCQRIDVDEELSRLSAHLRQFHTLLNDGGIVGKKIDFLIQEMHREANTFGAKSVALDTTQLSVELKVLIEQIKEQIQNIA
jgi:uncharacterized protein (TIGR00255 family)